MKEWLRISCLLCICGFVREIRPSESYITEYLLSGTRNLTQDELSREVYPVATYSYLSTLVVMFLITDFLRYKPLIIVMGVCGTVVSSMLLWTKSIAALQTLEFFYGLYMATEVAYYTYIYAKVDKQFYPKVTAHTRAAMFLGKLVAGSSAQILINLKLMTYKSLNYITLSTQIFSMLWAFTLPKVDKSLYFHRENYFDNAQSTSVVGSSSTDLQDTKSIKSGISENITPTEPFKLLWSHFYNAYSNLKVVQWSIWYAVNLAGYLQIISYIQVLWIEIEPHSEIAWNGSVDAVLTALSALMALAAGYIHAGRLKPLQSLLVLSIFAALEGGAILLCCRTSNIYVSYVGYILFGALYAFSITVASSEVARHLVEESFGLVFGVNTFLALVIQTLLTIIIVSNSGFVLNTCGQYTVYAFYFITASVITLFFVAVEYLVSRKSENRTNLVVE
ncbi:thiamine transporter 1-like [Anastrepha ludens]|uniref:thiamine transporter 1-like n=1 Tax=Anastrepha ludens TaxID=28586 RepID=UPI0023B1649E|nr:thiamine transporter 1-like [Anastrepha ludens]